MQMSVFSLTKNKKQLLNLHLHSPSNHIFCKQAVGGWKRYESRSYRSHLHPPWGDTCPETEGAACCHGTQLYTTGSKRTKHISSLPARLNSKEFLTQRPIWSLYLVVLLQNVVHLGYVLAGDDLDDVLLVIWRVETRSAAALSVAGNRGPACKRILPRKERTVKDFTLPTLDNPASIKQWKADAGISPRLQFAVSLECQTVQSGLFFYWASSRTEICWQILLIRMAICPVLYFYSMGMFTD